jgi:sugar phosphate isomerase/epimerase
LASIEDQAFAAVAMGFRQIEIGLSELPLPINGYNETRRETGLQISSVVAGCLKPRTERRASLHLASVDADEREQALSSVRRHIQLAQRLGAPIVVLRGAALCDAALRRRAEAIEARAVREGISDDLVEDTGAFVKQLVEQGQPQLEHLCRSLYCLMHEFPETRLALEPGPYLDDLLVLEGLQWVFEDLGKYGLGYWHDSGNIHVRERMGLPCQGEWLERLGNRMLGIHLRDVAENEVEKPPGVGEVDFRLIADYVPKDAARVVEVNPRHGRAEILQSIQFLTDQGF